MVDYPGDILYTSTYYVYAHPDRRIEDVEYSFTYLLLIRHFNFVIKGYICMHAVYGMDVLPCTHMQHAYMRVRCVW